MEAGRKQGGGGLKLGAFWRGFSRRRVQSKRTPGRLRSWASLGPTWVGSFSSQWGRLWRCSVGMGPEGMVQEVISLFRSKGLGRESLQEGPVRCPPVQPQGWFPSRVAPGPSLHHPWKLLLPGRGPPTPCRLAFQYQPGRFHQEPSMLNSSSLGAFLPPRRSSHSIVREVPHSGYILEGFIFKWFVKNKSYYFPSSRAVTVIPHSLAPLALRPG